MRGKVLAKHAGSFASLLDPTDNATEGDDRVTTDSSHQETGLPGNRLGLEKSPYLLQHAHNPVHWFPWGEEALEKAREEDKPIFLSVGYATCHWCHVMAHESFENQEVAEVLNASFVPVKVDREERPDIDMIYMNACQAMTRGGGWPLSVFLNPDGSPFFAGTYFPREPRMGMPGFTELLRHIARLWGQDRQRLRTLGGEVVQALQTGPASGESDALAGEELLEEAFSQLLSSFDREQGGFGPAPKFPTPHNLSFLLRYHRRTGSLQARAAVEKTLQAMRNGGLFDQIGLGFHRYSVDGQWLVPHFEKMLYDQAGLAMAYAQAFQATGEQRYARVVEEIFTYVLRDMTSPEGAFFCAQDADSEGREGLFYVWTPEQITGVLGKDRADLFCRFYDIRKGGNFEDGLSIPHVPLEPADFAVREGMALEELESRLQADREILFQERTRRPAPLKDDKILTSWNGFMIAALAIGARALGHSGYARAAGRAVDFLQSALTPGRGRLLRRYRDGEARLPGYADDYAFLVWGLIELYEATFEPEYLEKAVLLQESMVTLFHDKNLGGFFFSGSENESLVIRSKEAYDQAVPSCNAVAAMNLLRLGRMTGVTGWEQLAEQTVGAFSDTLSRVPSAHTHLLGAVDFLSGPAREIVIAGDPGSRDTEDMLRAAHRAFLPNTVLLLRPTGSQAEKILSVAPHLRPMEPVDGRATAFVCQQHTCREPVTDQKTFTENLLLT